MGQKWTPTPCLIFKIQHFSDRNGYKGQIVSPCNIFFQNGGSLLSWICYARVWTTYEGHLVIFITEQNLVGIDAVVSIIMQVLS